MHCPLNLALALALVITTPAAVSAVESSSPDPSSSPAPEASPAAVEVPSMRITSPAFEDEADIPVLYTCDGADISPPLQIEDLPPETVSLVLVMDDPDAPVGTWDHWVAYDIAPTLEIPEADEELGTSGTNSWENTGYGGPCPPSGTHRYIFGLFALDAELGWEPGADKTTVLEAIHDHVLAEASLLGFYSRE
jgi:Raf kinase inhibitor-like YbhB/YbcL family protein